MLLADTLPPAEMLNKGNYFMHFAVYPYLISEKISELQIDLATDSFGDLTGLTAERIADRIETFLKSQK